MEGYRRRRVLAALGTTPAVALAGCMGDGGKNTTDEPSESDNPTATDSNDGQSQGTESSGGNDSEQTSSLPTQQVAQLTGKEGPYRDKFGKSVAMSSDGSTVLVGAIEGRGPENEGFGMGAAYVFNRSDGEWQETARLNATDGDDGDEFGRAIALSDDGQTAIIGAPSDRYSNASGVGSAYIFDRIDSGWQQTATLAADDRDRGDRFGSSVALSGDGSTAIAGAVLDEDPHGEYAGSAYVFERSGDWQQTAKLVAEDGSEKDNFAASVAVSGDGGMATIGATGNENSDGVPAGAVYVFERSDDWQQKTKLTLEDVTFSDRLGTAITMSANGDTVFIGNSGDQNPAGVNTGSAYVFEQNGDWQQTAKLSAEDGDSNDYFGDSISVSSGGGTVIVGARGDDRPDVEDTGSAYVFEQNNDWQQAAKLTIDDADRGDDFGISVAMSGDGGTAVVGGNWHHDEIQPAYIFK
jgi:uncharacterized protein YciU (UPF0263 family)